MGSVGLLVGQYGSHKTGTAIMLGLDTIKRGPCIAVTLNDRLDYFGRTVNLAARLQGESRGDDIVMSRGHGQRAGG